MDYRILVQKKPKRREKTQDRNTISSDHQQEGRSEEALISIPFLVHLTLSLPPHLDIPHRHPPLRAIRPRVTPQLASVEKFFWGVNASVDPGFVSDAILEEAIGTADSNVQNEVEGLVKRRVRSSCRRPRIEEGRLVDLFLAEAPAVPHALIAVIKLDEEDLLIFSSKSAETCQ